MSVRSCSRHTILHRKVIILPGNDYSSDVVYWSVGRGGVEGSGMKKIDRRNGRDR